MCFDNTESQSRAQTLQFQGHPRPSCESASLKREVQFYGEYQKNSQMNLIEEENSKKNSLPHRFSDLTEKRSTVQKI
jgi:NAD-dependent SIR2 family protein deacetylase